MMKSLLIYNSASKVIVFCLPGRDDPALLDQACNMSGRNPADHTAVAVDGKYTTSAAIEALSVTAEDQIIDRVKTTDELKAAAIAALAQYRWQIETGGYSYNNWPVHSDDRAQFKALAEVLRIQNSQRLDGDAWKFADGEFRSLTNNEFLAMYSVGVTHIEKCFACETACKVRVEAGEYTIGTIWNEEWALL
ncbi:MAG: DUF4376 domain-containing protein [Desulfuromusa sp.]|nr:DUF4376 domain-containing protein [Desulfuromusa sp.]